MKSSIFLKSFRVDLKWLIWCLRFLKKNWKTESEFVISVPNDSVEAVKSLDRTLGHPIRVCPMDQWDNKGYVHQQYMKHMADVYCDGDIITYFDSDAMLVRPTSLEEDLLCDGNPVMWYTEYTRIHAPWDGLVNQVMCLQPKHEFMRSFPLTYHKSTITNCRAHLERLHGRPLHDFMSSVRSWSEFNIIGFYAYIFERNKYVWLNTYEQENGEHYRNDRVRQFHSVFDWNDAAIPYLSEMYGEPVDDISFDAETARVTSTPQGGQEKLIAKILPYIEPHSYVIDVGAHIGLHSIAYAKAGATVLAFEPHAESFTQLWRSLHFIGQTGHAYPFAVSDFTGTLKFVSDKDCAEASYVSESGESVPCIHLDGFCGAVFDLEHLSLIKVDVEGHELSVLKGAKHIIRKYKPVLVLEIQKDALSRNHSTKEDIYDFLAEMGYTYNVSMTDPRANEGEHYFFDIIACPIPKLTDQSYAYSEALEGVSIRP